jgi:hypothetical protein
MNPSDGGENSQEISKDLKRFEKWSLVVQVVMCIVTCAYIIFAGLQWKVMSRQLDLMHVDQRAWLAPVEVTSEPLGSGTIFKVLFRNTGKTPGIDVSAWINRTTSLPQITALDPGSPNKVAGLFAPNAVGNTSTSDVPIGAKDVEAIGKGLHVYIYGTIRYGDIFKKQHWTQFCYFPGPDLKSFGSCPIHNGCDDCEQPKANK